MSVLEGPRKESRRVLVGDAIHAAIAIGDGILLLDNGKEVSEHNVVHLAPCQPTKIICPHLTYKSRGIESRNKSQPTENPTYFMKPITAINSHGGEIVKPEDCEYLNYEGEFAAIIGREARNVTPEEAWDYIAGFSPALDMGLHDFRDTDSGSMLRVKGSDGFCPIGPGVVSGIDPRQQAIRTFRNGLLVQEADINDELIWGPDYMIADLSRHITLVPGDIILTGTPCHSRSLDVGDKIEVEITEIGKLSATIVSGPAPRSDVGHLPTDSNEVRRVALGNDKRVPEHLKINYRKAKKA